MAIKNGKKNESNNRSKDIKLYVNYLLFSAHLHFQL